MKKITISILALWIGVFSISCKDDSCCAIEEKSAGHELDGTWLMYETGYSPGGEYITNAVPAYPVQTITFQSNDIFSSTSQDLADYKFYQILDDALSGHGKVLSIYKKDISIPVSDPSQSVLSYSFTLNDNDLKLYYRFCVEGCHMAFRKTE